MNSLILHTASRLLHPLLLLYAVYLLFSGHNVPGGGFCAGLIGAASFALHTFAHDVPSARKLLRADPHTLIGTGLLFAMGSALLSAFRGQAFMTGLWGGFDLSGLGHVSVGTPVIFDTGVFLVVLGVTLLIIFTLSES